MSAKIYYSTELKEKKKERLDTVFPRHVISSLSRVFVDFYNKGWGYRWLSFSVSPYYLTKWCTKELHGPLSLSFFVNTSPKVISLTNNWWNYDPTLIIILKYKIK